jgi:hypothetical protein
VSFAGVWLERGENTFDPNQECPSRFTVCEKGIVMTMIGIDPHKATHTAVAVDDDENVIDEFTLKASRSQTERLTAWLRDSPSVSGLWSPRTGLDTPSEGSLLLAVRPCLMCHLCWRRVVSSVDGRTLAAHDVTNRQGPERSANTVVSE